MTVVFFMSKAVNIAVFATTTSRNFQEGLIKKPFMVSEG
jgi:hypothetical protein